MSSVDLKSPLLHAKFQDHRTLVLEKMFYHIRTRRLPRSCDQGKCLKTYVPSSQGGFTLNLALTSKVVTQEKRFEQKDHIHVNRPSAGADTPYGLKCI